MVGSLDEKIDDSLDNILNENNFNDI